jgi:hypothetical protein
VHRVVDGHVLARLQPDCLQAERAAAGRAAGGHQQLVADDLAAVVQDERDVAAGRRTSVAFRPVSTVIPASSNAARSRSDAAGSALGSSLGPCWTIVTSSAPSRRIACAISQPTTPPPITINRCGTFSRS